MIRRLKILKYNMHMELFIKKSKERKRKTIQRIVILTLSSITHFIFIFAFYIYVCIKESPHLPIHQLQFLFKQSVQTCIWDGVKTSRTLLVQLYHSFLVFVHLGQFYNIAIFFMSTFFDTLKASIFESRHGHA